MRRFVRQSVSLILAPLLGAGLASTGSPVPDGRAVPDWMEVDRDAETVEMEIVAGASGANAGWNFNGYAGGNARITVPEGWEITVRFRNAAEATAAHSLGIDEMRDSWPATFRDPEPVFEGAVTASPTRTGGATQPGESETLVFTASQAGKYAVVCHLPGHATAGMWIRFVVSAGGEVGFEELE